MWFSFLHTTLCSLSCPATCVPFLLSKHGPVTLACQLQKGARLILKALCSHSSAKKKKGNNDKKNKIKNSYGCNICIPDLWFEGKNLQCFLPCFLIGGMTKQDWNLNCVSPAWQHVSPSGPSKAQGGGFTPVVCLLHDKHSSPFSCILPLASSSPSPLKSETKPPTSPTQLEENQRPDSCDRMEYF